MKWIAWPDLVDVLGRPAAHDLCATHGGISTYLPARANRNHPWCKIIGETGMTLLCAYAGGTYVCVPNRRRSPAIKRRIIELLTEGASPEEIARDCECTERYVFAVAARTQSNQRLMPLPGLG